jgi:hypothetical protein
MSSDEMALEVIAALETLEFPYTAVGLRFRNYSRF